MIAVGMDASGNVTSQYVGGSKEDAVKTLGDAIAGGSIVEGAFYNNPHPDQVLRIATVVPPPAAPPTVTALNPATGPANTDITVDITGTGFDTGATVNIGTAHSIVPSNITPTDISVLIKAVNIAAAGTLAVSVTNGDGQESNAVNFTVT